MSRFLALDPDPSGPLVATATVGRGGMKLERVLAWPDGEPPPASPAALGARLKELMRDAKIPAAPVLVSLPREKVVLKDVRHPKTPPAQEPAVVKFQAKKELAGSPDEVEMDYLPVPVPPGATDCRATVVFVNKQVYADLKLMCEAAGLKLAAVTPRPFAAAAAYRRAVTTAATHPPDDTAAPVAVLSLSDRGGEFTVVHGDQIPFTRTVPASAVSGEAVLLGEVKRNLAMYAAQHPGANLQAVYLTEGSTSGRSWGGRLQTGLPLPVYPFDPTAGATNAADLPDAARGRFVGPVGLLAARGESDKLPINFVTPRAPKAEPSKARTGILLGVLLALVILGGGAAFGYWKTTQKQREVADLEKQLRSINGEIDAASYDKKRLAALDDFTRRRLSPLDVLYELTIDFPTIEPDKLQLIEYSLKAHKTPLAKTGPGAVAPKGPVGAGGPGTPGGATKGGPPTPLGKAGPGVPGAPGGAAPAPVIPLAERPVADLTLIVAAKDAAEIEKLKDILKRQKHFTKVTSAFRSGSGDRTQYEVTAELLAWPSKEFTRKLNAEFPKAPKPVEPEEPTDPGPDPLEPMLDPFMPPAPIPTPAP